MVHHHEGFRRRIRVAVLMALATIAAGPVIVAAGTLGNVFLDYNGGGFTERDADTPDYTKNKTFDVNKFDVTKFGLAAGDAAKVQDKVLADLNALYAGFNVNFSDSRAAAPVGAHHTLFIGEDKTNPVATGIADSIDWRDLDKNGKAVVFLGQTRADPTFPKGKAVTVDSVALAIANVAGHELGHLLGLSHTDTISSGDSNRDMINTSNVLNASNTIGAYSRLKLLVAQDGIANFDTAGNDAGDTFATATNINPFFDANHRLNVSSVLFNAADKDFFSFTMPSAGRATIEVFSERFEFKPIVGHDASLQPDVDNTDLKLFSGPGVQVAVPAGQRRNLADGTAAGNDLIFNLALGAGNYAFSVEEINNFFTNIPGEGGPGGFYEVLVSIVPEPTTVALVGSGLVVLVGWRLRRRPAPADREAPMAA